MNSKGIDCLGDNGVCIPINTHSVKTFKKQTNADRIRAMSNKELAVFLQPFLPGLLTVDDVEKWLEEDVEG